MVCGRTTKGITKNVLYQTLKRLVWNSAKNFLLVIGSTESASIENKTYVFLFVGLVFLLLVKFL